MRFLFSSYLSYMGSNGVSGWLLQGLNSGKVILMNELLMLTDDYTESLQNGDSKIPVMNFCKYSVKKIHRITNIMLTE